MVLKLAEALRLRADYSKKLDDIKAKIPNNCKGREGVPPIMDPLQLAAEYNELNDKTIKLVTLINLANAKNYIEYPLFQDNSKPGEPCRRTMTEALVEREMLKKKITMYRKMLDNADTSYNRYEVVPGKMDAIEYKIVPTFDIKSVQDHCDRLSKFLRMVDAKIQERNWTAEIAFNYD